jgi:hypothetical protein
MPLPKITIVGKLRFSETGIEYSLDIGKGPRQRTIWFPTYYPWLHFCPWEKLKEPGVYSFHLAQFRAGYR